MAIGPDTPLFVTRGIGPTFLKRLHKLGIKTVRDLIFHFPSRYEDFSQIYKIADLGRGGPYTIQGTVGDVNLRRTWRRGLTIVEATIEDDSGEIKAIWFNQPYILDTLRNGRLANFSGKVAISDDELYLSHPAYELISTGTTETKHTARLVPIYPETRGLTSRGIRFVVHAVLKNLIRLREWVPQEILREEKFPEINLALRTVHFPDKIEDALMAKKRFAFEDIFLLQLVNLKQKLKLAEQKASAIKTDIEKLKKILAELPWELTNSQKKSLWEIIQDIGKPVPMNRLLQGDVGSGKTAVAALAAVITAENNLQTAFMAPTEVLVEQHFTTLKKLFSKISVADEPTMALLTSANTKIIYGNGLEARLKKSELVEKIKSGGVKIVIGTHALIEKSVAFKNLGLVIVDEQHRFGVRQRAELIRREYGGVPTNSALTPARQLPALVPHFLSMSATPIPRTLMLTIFGDLDISLITELPAGRKDITTKIVPPAGRREAYEFIREEVKKGRQVFVICPRIDKAQTNADSMQTSADKSPHKSALLLEVKSVKEEYEKLSKKIFPSLRVAMLHGQLKPAEKQSAMRWFADGEIDILVSTSVVEVGVDVPNASIMMIEGADRFGLAQLYQFRGRVGRGEHQSYCFLFTDSAAKTTRDRLRAILEAKNGFELAEKDLKIRGPGEFLGQAQTGLPDIAMSALQDISLIKASREAAIKLVASDANFKKHPLLKLKIADFEKKIHLE